jgi:hypothetical protein
MIVAPSIAERAAADGDSSYIERAVRKAFEKANVNSAKKALNDIAAL